MKTVLACDVGGTKTVVALYAQGDRSLTPLCEAEFDSAAHPDLEAVIAAFLDEAPTELSAHVEAACLGVAGPVVQGRAKLTNLDWELDESALSRRFGIRRVALLNDLEACAYGMLELPPEDLVCLQEGLATHRRGNVAVIAAGTGLGEALLVWDGQRHRVMATEAGHAGFAPRDEEEIGLLRRLQSQFGSHVSCERVLSGAGFFRLYRYLRETSGEPEPAWLSERLGPGDPSATVAEVGLAGEDEVCARTVRRFAAIYGSEAGNHALRSLALGGVLIGGGIAPKLLPALRSAAFLDAFRDKGRFSELLSGLAIHVALDPRTPVFGAAVRARSLV